MNFQKVPTDYLQEVILHDNFVKNTVNCYRLALNFYHDLIKKNEVNPKASKLLRLGGKEISPKVKVVLNLLPESLINYPDVPEVQILFHCSLTLNGYIYCIGGTNTNPDEVTVVDNVCRLNLKKEMSS